jgi:ubiquinone biosynthesis protein
MRLSQSANRVKGIRRFSVITRVLVKHGLGDILDRIFFRGRAGDTGQESKVLISKTVYPSAGRIRRVLEELGPSFIKLGQLMSTRSDIFPPEYIREFKKLQDRVPPIPYDQIKTVIEDDLMRPLDEIFESFAKESLAAASVAQVHLAELKHGKKVAVKVIRPGIHKKIREDIRLMYYFAEKIENAFEIGRVIGAINLVKEFERNILRELDMFTEAGNIERFADNFSNTDELYIPRVHWNLTSRSVLVMEHIEGIKMDQVAQIEAQGIDPKEIAMIGLRSFSRQLMEFGLFHADPHPGNVIVMFDGRVSLVDFGITGYLDEETMMQIANIFLGYAEHDYDMIMEALEEAGLIDSEAMDLDDFRIDLKDISEPFYGRTLQTISVKDVNDQIMQLVLKYHIRLPRNLLLLLKTFIQTEALGKILGSDASLLEVTRPYAKKLLQRGYDAQKMIRNIGKEARTLGGYMKMMPKVIYDVLKTTASGRHRLEVIHSGFEQIDTKIEKGINRLTVGIVIAASLIAASLILNSSQTVVEFSVNLLGVHKISITALLGLTGYTLATFLGFWLIISIFRSGRM